MDNFKSEVTKSSTSTSSGTKNYNPTDKATMEYPVSGSNYGRALQMGPELCINMAMTTLNQ